MKNFILLCVFLILSVVQNNGELQELLDLSWNFDNDTVYWKGVRPFSYTKKIAEVVINGHWYAMNEFCAGEHGGTHFDAPYHFYKDGWTVEQVPLTHLIATGITVDLTKEVKKNGSSTLLLPSHLTQWQAKYGTFPENCVLLIRFGWSQYYPNVTKYLGQDNEGHLAFPGLSPQAAVWIANSKRIIGVGLDTASVDPGQSNTFDAHRILAEKQIYVLENVNIPASLPERGFTLFVMPMKLVGGTGAPVRIIAVPSEGHAFKRNAEPYVMSGAPHVPFYGHIAFLLAVLSIVLLQVSDWLLK